MLFCPSVMPSSGEGNGTQLQYSCLENPMDGGAWWAAVHGVAKSWTQLSDFTFNFHFHALEKEMATHSSVPAWRIPGTGEPGGLLSVGSHRVRHDWSDFSSGSSSNALFILPFPRQFYIFLIIPLGLQIFLWLQLPIMTIPYQLISQYYQQSAINIY